MYGNMTSTSSLTNVGLLQALECQSAMVERRRGAEAPLERIQDWISSNRHAIAQLLVIYES